MTFRSPKLLKASDGQSCVRCGSFRNVVGAHYTGYRRLSYGGGLSIKAHDFLTADLCEDCHRWMDVLSRRKETSIEHSEEFQHYIILTLERRFVQGVIVVSRGRHVEITAGVDTAPATEAPLPKILPRRTAGAGRAVEGQDTVAATAGERP